MFTRHPRLWYETVCIYFRKFSNYSYEVLAAGIVYWQSNSTKGNSWIADALLWCNAEVSEEYVASILKAEGRHRRLPHRNSRKTRNTCLKILNNSHLSLNRYRVYRIGSATGPSCERNSCCTPARCHPNPLMILILKKGVENLTWTPREDRQCVRVRIRTCWTSC